MAQITQFYRGETIPIVVTPESGETLVDCVMLVYPDNLDLTDESNVEKIVKIDTPTTQDDSLVFTLSSEDTLAMTAGPYTVELYYGDMTIVRSNNAFVLVDSGYALNSTSDQS